jgi:tetratricopeptide (TPR) repeat protein
MALQTSPEFIDTYFALRDFYLKENDFQKIKGYMVKAVEYVPDNPYGYFYLGQAYYETGEKEKAIEMFKTCSKNM